MTRTVTLISMANNEWMINASRFCTCDYNHHSSNFIEGLNLSQTHYLISNNQCSDSFGTLNDIETDFPMSRLLSKYILSKIDISAPESKHKNKEMEIESKRNNGSKNVTNDEIWIDGFYV